MEKVNFTLNVYGNIVEIIPDSGVLDNSQYEIVLKGIKSVDGISKIDHEKVKVCTAMKPCFSDITAVESLIDIEKCDIPKDIVLYNLREASKYAIYLNSEYNTDQIDGDNVSFEVSQFVKYKAAKDSLLRFYIDMASKSGLKGQIGDTNFEYSAKNADISDLLKRLDTETKIWQDAVRGFKNEGRVKPRATLKSRTTLPLIDISNLSPIPNHGFERGV